MTFYFRYEKARMARARVAEANKGIGKPLVGGAFHLTDHNGKEFTQEDLKGKYSLVYFGFTHCPDICPEELDKMAGMIDQVKEKHGEGVMRNVFISCDPARDTPEVIRRYLAEFHEDILGMTGTWQEVKDVCKAYRVYFSTPADVKPGQDYLVDHSIYFYLMGEFGRLHVMGEAIADFIAQILRATSLRPLDATSLLMRLPRLSTTTSPTGGVRLTGHEDCRADVYGYVRYCILHVEFDPSPLARAAATKSRKSQYWMCKRTKDLRCSSLYPDSFLQAGQSAKQGRTPLPSDDSCFAGLRVGFTSMVLMRPGPRLQA
jgi:cytochrome oxidase Cu insertion factor (SCO1/SenC/PrrC family)